jgi:hypothetical protein
LKIFASCWDNRLAFTWLLLLRIPVDYYALDPYCIKINLEGIYLCHTIIDTWNPKAARCLPAATPPNRKLWYRVCFGSAVNPPLELILKLLDEYPTANTAAPSSTTLRWIS